MVSKTCPKRPKSDAQSLHVRKMRNLIPTALHSVGSTFATPPKLQNRFRHRWNFEAFSKSLQNLTSPKRPKACQMAPNMIPKWFPNQYQVQRKSEWLPNVPHVRHNVSKCRPKLCQMILQMLTTGSPNLVSEAICALGAFESDRIRSNSTNR